MEDDIYDFSGLSLDDLDPSRTKNGKSGDESMSDGGGAFVSTALFEGKYDEEEWYPPTPPPYDVADKLSEANRRLQEDPTSDVHVADRLRWRRTSSLVDICWLHQNGSGANGASSSGDEIVVIDDLGGRFVGEERPPGLAGATDDEEWSTSESVSVASARFALANIGAPSTTLYVSTEEKRGDSSATAEEEIEEEVDFEEEDLVSHSQNGGGGKGYVPNGHNTTEDWGGESEEETTTLRDSRKKSGRGEGSPSERRTAVVAPLEVQPPHLITSNGKSGARKNKGNLRNGGCSDGGEKGEVVVATQPQLAINGVKAASPQNNKKGRVKRSSSQDLSEGGSLDQIKINGVRSPSPSQSSSVLDRRRKNRASNSFNQPNGMLSHRGLPNSHSLPELSNPPTHQYMNGHVNGRAKPLFRRRNSSSPSPSSSVSPVPPPTRNSSANGAKQTGPPATKASLMPPVERKSISFRHPNGSSGTRRGCSSAPLLQRKISRNSLSSNSSLSSHSTEDSSANSSDSRQMTREAADQAFSQWKQRKREEKRLRERRTALLQAQLRAKL